MFAIIKFNLSCRQKNKRHSKSNGLFRCHGAENTFYPKFRPSVCLSVEFFENTFSAMYWLLVTWLMVILKYRIHCEKGETR